MFAHLTANNVLRMMTELDSPTDNTIKIAEKIDSLIVQASLNAEKRASIPYQPPQSKPIYKARVYCNKLRKLLFLLKNHPSDHTQTEKQKRCISSDISTLDKWE